MGICFLFCCTTGIFPDIFHQDISEYWYVLARSTDVYYVNTVDLENKIIKGSKNDYGYDKVNFTILKTLKGIGRKEINVSFYPDKNRINYLHSFSDEYAVIFLTRKSNNDEVKYYFATSWDMGNSLVPYSLIDISDIEKEINLQNKILDKKMYENFRIDDNMQVKVLQLIHDTTDAVLEKNAFEELQNLGMPAIPYMILYMNNYSPLPIRQISLENKSPYAFESTRHYGPYLVIDALAAITNQITGYDFGSIYNGDYTNNAERQHAYDGWRIYLYYYNIGYIK
jgi:hypothetical protein